MIKMDADLPRIFKRIQEEYNIEDITQDNINTFLNNKPAHKRTDIWYENGRKRERIVNVPFSSRKDYYAKDMGQISKIYEKADREPKEAEKEYSSYKNKYNLTAENKDKVDSKLGDGYTDKAIEYADKGDITAFKTLKTTNKESQDKIDNYAYNTVWKKIREYRDSKDISGLNSLKSQISGLRDESELDRDITDEIGKIERLNS